MGATEALAGALLGILNDGDEVIVFEPLFDTYAGCIALAGAVSVPITLRPQMSGRYEFDADEYSTSTYPKGVLASALGKISTDALANLNPHPLYVKVHYTHPPVIERLKALR
jgi:hypothetical protein